MTVTIHVRYHTALQSFGGDGFASQIIADETVGVDNASGDTVTLDLGTAEGRHVHEAVGGAAIISNARRVGAFSPTLDVSTHDTDDAYVRSQFDAMEVRIGDAPQSDELLLALVITDGSRPHPRAGGKTISEAEG